MAVRVRFAPSPTGIPHIGNTRTALFNWLFAKHNKGKFIVRIEDTDQKRLVPDSQEKIMQILDVIGLREDESYRVGGPYGPYIQSQRLDIYKHYAHQLVEKGKAYYCFCSPDRLSKIRKQRQKQGLIPKYDRHCLHLSHKQIQNRLQAGEPYVIRLKVPDNIDVTWDDLIQGPITINTQNLDDQILLKSDGFPTYHLAVVVDDHLMHITHVLRGAEWISSTPKHILLYQAFGWKLPAFGHFPLILGPDKTKLSKRHGAKSVLDYINDGYLPEALVNFMAFLGFNYKDNSQILTLKDLVDIFDLNHIGKSNPIFDIQKLNYFNKEHIKRLSLSDLVTYLQRYMPDDYPIKDPKTLQYLAQLCQPRMYLLTDFFNLTRFVYPDKTPDSKELHKRFKDDKIRKALDWYQSQLLSLSSWQAQDLEQLAFRTVQKFDLSKGKFYMALRVAVLINPVTPPLFESMQVLDKTLVIQRIKTALNLVT